MKTMHLLRPALVAASFLTITISINLEKAQAQSYETFSVNGGMALNTNNNFRLIDGQPRMSIWQHNVSDVDQQFQRLAQPDGSFLLRQRSTGKCLNAYRLWNGAEVNVWPCSTSDPDQRFRLNNLGSGVWQIQRSGTNLCIDSPTRSNGGILHLWACDANNPNQRWQSSLMPPPSSGNLVLRPSRQYSRGTSLATSNGYKLNFQTDGNLVLYTPSNYAIWATGTVGNLSSRLAIQSDGNIVLYDNINRPMWASNTVGNTNAFLAIQTDGNMVVYTSDGTRPLFATNTVGGVRRTLNAAAEWGGSPPSSGSYRNTIDQILNSFFSQTSNTNGEAWSNRSIQNKWDRIGGESAQFPSGGYTSGDLWQVDMPAGIYGVYQDLSTAMFGSVRTVTTGYAYDRGYYGTYGAHSAIDIGAANGATVKSPINGRVVDNRAHNHNGAFNGYWIAVDELNASGQRTGRRWWFGHLNTRSVSVGNSVVAGQTVLGTVGQGHVHLGVFSGYEEYTISRYGYEVRNGPTSLGYTNAVQDVLNRTMSPLQAYWKFRNGIRE